MKRRLPPYGKTLSERQRFKNLPFLVVVTIGMDAWNRCKRWRQSPNDIESMVLSDYQPSDYFWPVANCGCVIDRDVGPSDEQIVTLARALLSNGASIVSELFLKVKQRNELAFFEDDPEFVELPRVGRIFAVKERTAA